MKHLYSTSILSLSLLLTLGGCAQTTDNASDTNTTDVTQTDTTGNGGDSSDTTQNDNNISGNETTVNSDTNNSATAVASSAYKVVKRIGEIGNITALTKRGEKLYIGNHDGTLYVYDVSDAPNPQLLSTLKTDDIIEDIAVNVNTIYLANNQKGLIVVDASDSSNLVVTKKLPAGYARAVEVKNGTVYVAGGYQGITVFDTNTLTETATINVEGDFTDSIAIKDNSFAFTSDAYYSYSVITDLSTATKVGQVEKENSFYEAKDDFTFTQDERTLFLADGGSGFDIYDVSKDLSNSENILKYAHVDSPDNQTLTHITLSNNQNYAYVDAYNKGVLVYDITNLSTPKLITIVDLNETQNDNSSAYDSDLSTDGKYLFVSRGVNGFAVVQLPSDNSTIATAPVNYLNLDKWDIYGSAKNENNMLILGDSNGKDVDDLLDGDGNIWNKLADGSTQYDYDALVSKADFTPPLSITLHGTLHGSSFGYNNIGIAPKADNFTNVVGEGLPIGNDLAVFSLNWEMQNILRLSIQGYGYIDTDVSFTTELTGDFKMQWDGSKVSFYYNGTLLSENDLLYDASKTYKVYMKNYESDFEISSITIK